MIIAIIPAKGNSKRLKNKNLRTLNKKKLIQYSIEYVKKSNLVDDIYISTDSIKVANVSKKMNVRVILRSKNLGGETPIIDVYRHAFNKLKKKNINLMIGLQPDHPDRILNLDNLIKKFKKGKFTHTISYNKKSKTKDGSYYLMSKKHILNFDSSKPLKVFDNCTNIHNLKDLKIAEKKLKNET
jgi:CMP-N-acetylneuraminic acid synthetase